MKYFHWRSLGRGGGESVPGWEGSQGLINTLHNSGFILNVTITMEACGGRPPPTSPRWFCLKPLPRSAVTRVCSSVTRSRSNAHLRPSGLLIKPQVWAEGSVIELVQKSEHLFDFTDSNPWMAEWGWEVGPGEGGGFTLSFKLENIEQMNSYFQLMHIHPLWD